MATEKQDLPNDPIIAAGASTGVGVGPLLRETREKRGEELAYVASALRIRQPYLEAIEAGHFQELPGSTYAVGFVRGYAEYLGLDSKEIVRRFHQENREFTNRAELVFPSAVSEGSIPSGAVLGFALIAAVAAYGAWYWYQSRDVSVANAVPALPERLMALLHKPVGSGQELVPVSPADNAKVNEAPLPGQTGPVPTVPPLGLPHEDVVAPDDDAGGGSASSSPTPAEMDQKGKVVQPQTPAASPTVLSQAPQAAPQASQSAPSASAPRAPAVEPPADAAVTPPVAAAPPAVADDGSSVATPAPVPVKETRAARKARLAQEAAAAAAATGSGAPAQNPDALPSVPGDGQPAASAKGQVLLQAKEDCWIEIRDGKGRVVQSRLLHKGDSYTVSRRPGMKLTVGNAGALNVVVDGTPTGPLGSAGMVRRDMPLDADRLKEGSGATSSGEAAGEPTGASPTAPAASPDVPPAPTGGVPSTE